MSLFAYWGMKIVTVYSGGNIKGKELFGRLLKMADEKSFDDEYLVTLVEYKELYPESEKFDIFFAWYAVAHGNYLVALESALVAEKKRPLNFEVWKLLKLCYEAIGELDKSAVYEGLCVKFYAVPMRLQLSKDMIEEYFARLRRGMCRGCYAPFHSEWMEWTGQKLRKRSGIYAGEFIPGYYDAKGSGYWVGIYTGQEPMDNKGWLVSQHIEDNEYISRCGAEITFDVMKSQIAEQEMEITGSMEEPLIIPIAAVDEQQEITFSSQRVQDKAWLGKWEYSFFRIEEPVKIFSEHPFVVGNPIRLRHSPKRLKVVLNIQIDALCWPEMKRREYRDIPNMMKFFSKGVIFQNQCSVSEYTYPSLPTIETGMYPHHSQIFNMEAGIELRPEYKTIGEQLSELGYYCTCPMITGTGIYNGALRGYDRQIVTAYDLSVSVGVNRIIEQLEAFDECDQVMFIQPLDTHPWSAHHNSVTLEAEIHLPLKDRLAGTETEKASVYLPHTPLYQQGNLSAIRKVDRNLGELFAYLESHYRDDEYLVQVFSDHGVPIYDEAPDILSENQTGAAWMIRGAGVPIKGFVDELTSTVDIYPVTAKFTGFDVPEYVDGNLPKVFGGAERKHVVSNSIYPGQTYKLCVRTKEHEFRIESIEPVDEDGTVDLSDAKMHIFSRGEQRVEIKDEKLFGYFENIAELYTHSFNDHGHHWPSMREARPGWFNKK